MNAQDAAALQAAARSTGFGAGFGTGFVLAFFLATILMLFVGALREKRQRAEGLLWRHEQLDVAASQGPGAPPMSTYHRTNYRPKVNTAALEVEQVGSSLSEVDKV